MIRLLNLNSRDRYVLKIDPERAFVDEKNPEKSKPQGPNATIFELAVLPARVAGYLADASTAFRQTQGGDLQADIKPNKVAYDRVRLGLKSVENLYDGDRMVSILLTEEVVGPLGKQEVVSPEFMDRLPREVIMELAERLMEINKADSEALGNSVG